LDFTAGVTMPLKLTDEFINNVLLSFPAEGPGWLEQLPALLEQACRRWELTPGEPFLLSFNYVTAAQRADGSEAALKIGVPNFELASEIHALQWFGGDGVCRVLEADPAAGMLLLERLRPGEMLTSLKDDEQRTRIGAEVMARVRRPAPEGMPFIRLEDWFGELRKLRPRFGGGTGYFPRRLVEHVEATLPGLLEARPPMLIHGDLHHFNILSSSRGWLAIDPKGVVGNPEYEVGPFLINPWGEYVDDPGAVRMIGRRIAILSEVLGYERERIRDWGVCHAVLSAFWSMTPDTTGDSSLQCGEIIAQAPI
jgi:streptomycin 6-kinase